MKPARRAAGALVVGGLEACWLLPALALLETWSGRSLPLLWMAAGALLAAAFWRGTDARGPRRQTACRLGGGLAWTTAAWAAAAPTAPPLSAALPPALAAAAAWGWGCRIAAARFDPVQVLREFQIGLVALLAVAAGAAWQGIPLPGLAPAGCAFFLLFAAGAPAVRSGGRSAWPSAGARRTWIALSAANCAAILCLGAAAASVLTPEVLDAGLAAVSAAVQIVLDVVHTLMRSLAALVPGSGPMEGRLPGPSVALPERPILYHEILRLPEWLRWSAEAGTAIVWIVLVSVAVWRTVSQVAAWLRRQAVDLEGAEIEKVGGAFRRDLIRLLWWIRRCRAEAAEWVRSRLGREPASGAAAVRRRYRRLLAWAAAQGCRRPPAQTPNEFLERLCAWHPHRRAAFEMLTEQYVRTRYGGFSPTPEDLEAVERAWRAIRSRRPRPGRNPFNSPQDPQ